MSRPSKDSCPFLPAPPRSKSPLPLHLGSLFFSSPGPHTAQLPSLDEQQTLPEHTLQG